MDHPGCQVCGRDSPWRGVARKLRDVASSEVRGVRAAERRFSQDVGRGALPNETSQGIELARNLRRQLPDNLELQGAHPQRVETLVLVDSYGLGGEVPWGRLGYLLARAPLLDELA